MDLVLLMVRLAVWLAKSTGEAPTQENLEECVRGQIIPC